MFSIPTYKAGETYAAGTVVRYGDRLIVAKVDIAQAPVEPDEGWSKSTETVPPDEPDEPDEP